MYEIFVLFYNNKNQKRNLCQFFILTINNPDYQYFCFGYSKFEFDLTLSTRSAFAFLNNDS
jgi:hypothetical protein